MPLSLRRHRRAATTAGPRADAAAAPAALAARSQERLSGQSISALFHCRHYQDKIDNGPCASAYFADGASLGAIATINAAAA